MAPNDLTKLGSMFARGGTWNGRKIVSRAWLEKAMKAHVRVPPAEGAPEWARNSGYGYFWWVDDFLVAGRNERIATASGFGGQRLIVVPKQDLTVLVLAGFAPRDARATWYPEEILYRVLLAIEQP